MDYPTGASGLQGAKKSVIFADDMVFVEICDFVLSREEDEQDC